MLVYDRQSYFQKYGFHPLASYYISEYRTASEAEHHLCNFIDSHKADRTIVKLFEHFWSYVTNVANSVIYDEKKEMEAYLSQAQDLTDLEQRQRNWDSQKNRTKSFLNYKLQYS